MENIFKIRILLMLKGNAQQKSRMINKLLF